MRHDSVKISYDKSARISSDHLVPGDRVVVRNKDVWLPGTVSKVHDSVRSFMVKIYEGRVIRRNTSQLEKSSNNQDELKAFDDVGFHSDVREEKLFTGPEEDCQSGAV
ncbi:hypothetical protein JTB14_017142 [Gonioctena quinquepunctata]|nr:hypothetical protein JTB14_017142 [Gonioctena quinquepunctata]